jgi:hypothetical protein
METLSASPLNEYYIVSKMRDTNGQAEGKQKGRDVWKPVELLRSIPLQQA